MYSKVNSMAIRGIEGIPVSVEVDVSPGLPEFSLVGFLGSEVKEARERVRTSLRNSGYNLAARRLTVNLAPADLRKEGTAFDLAIAVGILCSYGLVPESSLKGAVFLGELGLDGRICPVPGILSAVLTARERGFDTCFVPADNSAEGAVVSGIRIIGAEHLEGLVRILNQPEGAIPEDPVDYDRLEAECPAEVDFAEVNGQRSMRRAAEVAAAGMHNLLFIGSPGSGKTMIARRIPTILPRLSREESLEVTRIYSVCGLLPPGQPMLPVRPFRAPHHTISPYALVGGGRIPRPGEVSLANRGVLFLDELPEFQKGALEALRQPLEDRVVTISRVQGSYSFPADVMLVAAMNPCRCGYYPDRSRCQCSEAEVRRYLRRISRPLLDRMDLCVEAPPVGFAEMGGDWENESSASIRERVAAAWERQQSRFQGTGIFFNSQMKSGDISRWCTLGTREEQFLQSVFQKMNLSARAYHRILKVARTIADLDGAEQIREHHLGEAVGYRGLDERFWG